MYYKIIRRFFQVSGEHFCVIKYKLPDVNGNKEKYHDSRSWGDEKSMTSPTRTFITPKNPWSFFLNFFWSNICTANILSSFARLKVDQPRFFPVEDTPYSQVEDLVPVWIQSPFDNSGRLRLLATQCRNCKRVRKS